MLCLISCECFNSHAFDVVLFFRVFRSTYDEHLPAYALNALWAAESNWSSHIQMPMFLSPNILLWHQFHCDICTLDTWYVPFSCFVEFVRTRCYNEVGAPLKSQSYGLMWLMTNCCVYDACTCHVFVKIFLELVCDYHHIVIHSYSGFVFV